MPATGEEPDVDLTETGGAPPNAETIESADIAAKIAAMLDEDVDNSCRGRLEATMDNPASPASIFVMLTIVFAIACFMLESVEEYTVTPFQIKFWEWAEHVCVVVFTMELSVKYYIAKFNPRFFCDIMVIVDIAAVAPWYIGWIIPGDAVDLSFLRAVRLLRVIRAVKLGNSSAGVKVFVVALKKSVPQLASMLFFMLVACIIFASLEFSFEKMDETSMFTSIPSTIWWCIVTMTTVGYGDSYPVTVWGKLVAIVAMLSGILIFALPITVIGSNYESAYRLEVMTRLILDWKAEVKTKCKEEAKYTNWSCQDVVTIAKEASKNWTRDHAILLAWVENMWATIAETKHSDISYIELQQLLDDVYDAIENATDFDPPTPADEAATNLAEIDNRVNDIDKELQAQREMLDKILKKIG